VELDKIKNKIIISGSAGVGKTRIIKDNIDKQGSIITALSKSASAGSYSFGQSTTKLLFSFFINTEYFEMYKKEVSGLESMINKILTNTPIPNDFKYQTYKKQFISKKMLEAFIFSREDKIDETISTRCYWNAVKKIMDEKDYEVFKHLKNQMNELLWKWIDNFIDIVFNGKMEIVNNPQKDIKLVFDEFTMIDSRRLEVIITLLQSRYNITHLVLVGDVAQLPSISGNNICNDIRWTRLLDDFKQYRLMKLWRFENNKNDIITKVVELPHLNEIEKISVCQQINDIMRNRRSKFNKQDIKFTISFTNNMCNVYNTNIENSNAYRRSSNDLETKSKKISQDVIDYFNGMDNINKIYAVNEYYLSELNIIRYKTHKLFQPFWNNGNRHYHSCTVHKSQGLTIENGLKTIVDIRGSQNFGGGLAYTAMTRNSNFDDVILYEDIYPHQFEIPSIYKFKFIELHDYKPLIAEL